MSNFDVNLFTNDCVDLQEQAKQLLNEYNETVTKYNTKVMQIKNHLSEINDLEKLTYTTQVFVDNISLIDIEKATGPLPSDMELITYRDLDADVIPTGITLDDSATQDIDNVTDQDIDYCDYDDYDDFSAGSNTRCEKGTGKLNYNTVYNAKHVRAVTNRKT